MPDPLFERLYRESTKMNWQPTEDIRRQAARRTARQRTAVIASTFAAVILLAASVTVIAWHPNAAPINPGTTTTTSARTTPNPDPTTTKAPTTTTTTTQSQSPIVATSVPITAMLQTADVGFGVVNDDVRGGDWPVEWLLNYCGNRTSELDLSAVDARTRAYEVSQTKYLVQYVYAYPAGAAHTWLGWLRSAVTACSGVDLGTPTTLTVVAESFAGDESVMVQTSTSNGRELYAIVREGNLVSEVHAVPYDQAGLTILARQAVARMCPLTHTC